MILNILRNMALVNYGLEFLFSKGCYHCADQPLEFSR